MKAADLVIPKEAEKFGLSANRSGGHLARSMMLPEIGALVTHLPMAAGLGDFTSAILSDNLLAKPTNASREKSLRHLIQLYGLDSRLALFRLLRRLAAEDPQSLPLMAMTCAFCRDAQLRASFDLLDQLRPGQVLARERMEQHLEQAFPRRFSAAMKKSLAQNVNTTWTEAGHLTGRTTKVRVMPQARMGASVYAMFAGYLLGLRGELLINSVFARLVAGDSSIITSHLASASAQGYLRFRHAGGVVEADFTPLLTEEERLVAHGAH